MNRVVCLLFCLLLHASFIAQKPVTKKAAVLKTDSSLLQVRSFNAASMNKYRTQRDFKYEVNETKEISFWEIFWQWFDNLLAGKVTGPAIRTLFIVLGAAAIVLMVLKLAGMDMMQIFTGKTSTLEVPYQESLENIHEISFEDEIEKAVVSRNFRLAVRLLYLNCLKKLSDAGAIKWQQDKTNLTYLHEIQNPEQQQKFGLLTRQFEYVWYGDFKVVESHFQQIRNSFQQFNPKLK